MRYDHFDTETDPAKRQIARDYRAAQLFITAIYVIGGLIFAAGAWVFLWNFL